MKIICGSNASSAGSQCPVTAARNSSPPDPARSGTLIMFSAVLSTPQYGYSGCWNVPTMSTRGSPCEDVLRPVSVVDVEVDDRHARQAMRGEGVRGADGDVVEEAEAHGALALAWWPGGRTAQNAVAHSPRMTRSTAITTAPAACFAAFSECGLSAVSGSM